MAWCIFNCEWLNLGKGPEAARLDVRGIKKLCGHKGGRLVHKGTSLYALARSCGVLVLKVTDSEWFLYVWDFGKSRSDGAGPRTVSETHSVVMMRRLTA